MKTIAGVTFCIMATLGLCAPILVKSTDERVKALAAAVGVLGLGCALLMIISASGG